MESMAQKGSTVSTGEAVSSDTRQVSCDRKMEGNNPGMGIAVGSLLHSDPEACVELCSP